MISAEWAWSKLIIILAHPESLSFAQVYHFTHFYSYFPLPLRWNLSFCRHIYIRVPKGPLDRIILPLELRQLLSGCGERITVISLSRMHFALPQTAQLFFGMLMENKSSKPRVVVLRASHNRKAESPSTQPVRLVLATRTPLL